MSFRKEEKLYIKHENLNQFKEFLIKKAAKKLYQPRIIKSLYFDNSNFDMYKDSIEGSVPRKKIRIREYPQSKSQKYYLEIKTSSVEGRYKTRREIDKERFTEYKNLGLLDSDYGTCLANYFVSYERQYALIDDIRISIDEKISYTNFKTNKIYFDNNSIVELKTSINKNPDDIIKIFPFQKIRFSKYCLAVEKLN